MSLRLMCKNKTISGRSEKWNWRYKCYYLFNIKKPKNFLQGTFEEKSWSHIMNRPPPCYPIQRGFYIHETIRQNWKKVARKLAKLMSLIFFVLSNNKNASAICQYLSHMIYLIISKYGIISNVVTLYIVLMQ